MEDWIRKREQLIGKAKELDVWRDGLDGQKTQDEEEDVLQHL